MRFRLGVLAAVTGVAGCYSVDDVRKQPVSWTATYSAPYNTVANCLAAQYAGELSVLPQDYPAEKRANVILTNPSARGAEAEFEIKQVNPTTTEVTWRRMGSLFGDASNDRRSRERADRCGKAA